MKARYALPELSEDEEIEFSNAEHCIFCTKVLGTDRVRDHNHYTGKYNGAAHQKCNLLATETTTTIPCYFHNMNYDIKQFLPAFEKLKGEDYFKHASVIPCNMEQYKCLRLDKVTIYDSYAHLPSPLDVLIKQLPDKKKMYL